MDAAPALPAFDPSDPLLGDAVERRIARYRPLLHRRALRHFQRVAFFLLETHPAASQWHATLLAARAAAGGDGQPAPRELSPEALAAVLSELGVLPRPKDVAAVEDGAEVLLHEAETGVRFLVEAPFPEATTPEAAQAALDRFLGLTFASLFGGLLSAIFHRGQHGGMDGPLAAHFLGPVLLFRRLDLQGRDARTFTGYFLERRSAQVMARHSGGDLAREREVVFRFLEMLDAFVAAEGPALVREVEVDPARVTRASKPWVMSLLQKELGTPPGKSKRRRGS
jgi:hypothetical protein